VNRFRLLAAALAAGALLACGSFLARPMIKSIDETWLGYRLTDQYVRMRSSEDWSAAVRLRANLDFRWAAPDESATIRIAHALGAWRSDRYRNTLTALHQSIAKKFSIVEVDLALGKDGRLYCFHGADGGAAYVPASQIGRICTFDNLIDELRTSSIVLVLDLKSNFARSSAVIAERVPPELRHRIVFQLYEPADIATFNALPDGFAGPIVTLYRTSRTVSHLDPELARIGARVVTVPFSRVREFGRWGARDQRILLTHPIENCGALHQARSNGFEGGYMDSDLACAAKR